MRSIAALFAVLLATSYSASCASVDGPDGNTSDSGELPFDFVTPLVDQVSPNQIALGDVVQVFGDGFIGNEYGSTKLVFDGRYNDDQGQTHKYQGEVLLDVKNSAVASFAFDDLIFVPSGDRIGVFDGTVSVVSQLKETYQRDDIQNRLSSESISISLQIKPSIAIQELRSVTEVGCAAISTTTIGEQELNLTLNALGMQATEANPIRFRITFLSPTINVTYIKKDTYDIWPPNSPDPSFVAKPSDGPNSFDIEITEGNTLKLNPTFHQQIVTLSPAIQIGAERLSKVALGGFATAATNGKSTTTNIRIEAFDTNGATLHRDVQYNIKEKWEVQPYNQNVLLMERSDAIPVSGCFSGGDEGRDLSYSEGTSVTQSRSLSFRWDRNVANTFGVTTGTGFNLPLQLSVNAGTTFSDTFGVDINESVSSESHVGINFSARIISGYFGTCYRQVDRINREVNVKYNNGCGSSGIIGQTILTDWNFGFDIATGPSCGARSDLEEGGNYEPSGVEHQCSKPFDTECLKR